MKRLYTLSLVVALILGLTACSKDLVKGSIVSQANDTMAQLDVMPQKLLEFAEIGDIVRVIAGDFDEEMPLVDELIADEGELQLLYDSNEHSLYICSYNQNFFETYNVSPDTKVRINKK